ncbi:MAG: hypothetical protein ACTSWA_04655 [Candidatus Thorarchaeota archaeon]
MTDPPEKSSDSEKEKSKESRSDFADRLVESMAKNLAAAQEMDTDELDRLEREKEKRLDAVLDEPLPDDE